MDILSVILKTESLAPGFLHLTSDSPVCQIARATERYSGSDLKELCKAAAYGPIRDLLRDEQKARVEKSTRRVEKAVVNVKGLGGGLHSSGKATGGQTRTKTNPVVGPGVDDLDGDDVFHDADEEEDVPVKRLKRAMTLSDFVHVLSKSGTSADMAAKYRHADNERRFDRDARAHSSFNGFPTGPETGASTPEQNAAMEAMLTPEIRKMIEGIMGAQTAGADTGAAAADQNQEVTPEMLSKMMEAFMVQRASAGMASK